MADDLTRSWVRNPSDERAAADGCRFDLKAAKRVEHFFRTFLRHSKGQWAGKPFELLDWQRDELIYPLFGWKRPDGTRRFRSAYVELPKKNGKSTLGSGIGLYLLMGDGEPGAEVYSCATSRDQAVIVHGEAVRMVEASEALQKYLAVNHTTNNIAFARTNSWYRALSSEAETKEGLNAHGLVIDELHVWSGRQLWNALRYAGRSRRQPLRFVITTAGEDMNCVCREQHDYSKDVLKGTVKDARHFALIKAARRKSEGDEDDDDWTAEEAWRRANPSLGLTINLDDFCADVEEAKRSPAVQASFCRYGLNVWGLATSPWLDPADWKKCEGGFDPKGLLGKPCWGGLDLSKTRDMTALALVFKLDADRYALLAWFWLPEDVVSSPEAPEEYRVWKSQGLIETTPGAVCDYRHVKRRLGEIKALYDLKELAYDPYNAEQLTQEVEEEHGVKRVLFPQTINAFASPTGEFERLVISGGLRHDGNAVLAWQAGNVRVRADVNNNKRPVKPTRNDRRKIDGIVSAIMALARATQGESVQPSVYETRGLATVGAEPERERGVPQEFDEDDD